jgi:hypothetical protein
MSQEVTQATKRYAAFVAVALTAIGVASAYAARKAVRDVLSGFVVN